MIWAYLVHLSFNMWGDRIEYPNFVGEHYEAQPYLRCDRSMWDSILEKMVESGLNMLVIDLGDGVRYESHPEIAVKNAWSTAQLREELQRIREMGIEPIPKLNFSTCHDMWLGRYSRMVSTEEYYQVCRDLIGEVMELFDKPRFFHLGMDEEDLANQRLFKYVVIRQYDLWWHDFALLAREVEKHGGRPWVWSDYCWHHLDDFLQHMPRSVVQSNWYYHEDFGDTVRAVQAYLDLDAQGYSQIPGASNWACDVSFPSTVEFCKERLSPDRLLGFLQTCWIPTLEPFREKHMHAIELVAEARRKTVGS